MKRINTILVLSLFPVALLVLTVIFYVLVASLTGNVFERESGKFRPFAFADPFTRPIDGPWIPSEGMTTGEYLWLVMQASAWAWPFNTFAWSNPYVYFIMAAGASFGLFTYYQLNSEPEQGETIEFHKSEVNRSIRDVGLGILGELVVFSAIVYAFFKSKAVTGLHWSSDTASTTVSSTTSSASRNFFKQE
jgi:hypothetical protein